MADNWYIILELEFDPPVEDEQKISERIDERAKFWSAHFNDFKMGAQYRVWYQKLPQIKKDMIGSSNIRKKLATEACKIAYEPIDRIIKIIGRNGCIADDELKKIAKKFLVDVSVVAKRVRVLIESLETSKNSISDKSPLSTVYADADNAMYKSLDVMLNAFNSKNLYEFLYSNTTVNNASRLPCEALRLRAIEKKKNEFFRQDYVSGIGCKLSRSCEIIFKDEVSKQKYDKYLKARRILSILDDLKTVVDITGKLSSEIAEEIYGLLNKEVDDNQKSCLILNEYYAVELFDMTSVESKERSQDDKYLEQCIRESKHINYIEERLAILEKQMASLDNNDEYDDSVFALSIRENGFKIAGFNNEEPVVLPNEQGELTTPNYIYCDESKLLVGEYAKEISAIEPKKTFLIDPGKLSNRRLGYFRGHILTDTEGFSVLIKNAISYLKQSCEFNSNNVIIVVPIYFLPPQTIKIKRTLENINLNLHGVTYQEVAIFEYVRRFYGNVSEKFIIINFSENGVVITTWIQDANRVVCSAAEYGEFGYRACEKNIFRYLLEEFCEKTGVNETEIYNDELYEIKQKAYKIRTRFAFRESVAVMVYALGDNQRVQISREQLDILNDDLIKKTLNLFECSRTKLTEDSIDVFVVGVGVQVDQVVRKLNAVYSNDNVRKFPEEIIPKGALYYTQTENKSIIVE